MNIQEAQKLRESIKGKDCKHVHVEKEEMNGTHTGDYVCISCGAIVKETEEKDK